MENELMHYGVPGMKWGVRKATYARINRSSAKIKDNNRNISIAKRNVKRFSKHSGSVSKFLAKTNKMTISHLKASNVKNQKKIDDLINSLKNKNIKTITYYDPYLDTVKYKAEGDKSHYGYKYI